MGAGGGCVGQRSAISELRGSGPPLAVVAPALPPTGGGAPPSRCTVGRTWVGGPGSAGGGRPAALSPPHCLAPAVWAVTCVAACVGIGAVAVAGFAGSSASGSGCCARPGGASCWRPHP